MSGSDPEEARRPETVSDFRAALGRERFLLVAFVAAAWGRRFPDRSVIEDLVQETLVIALARRADFDPDRSLGAWLRGIATNLVIGALRREARRRRIVDEGKHEIDRVAALSHRFDMIAGRSAAREVSQALRDCLERIATAQRDVIERHYLAGQSFRTIASELEVSEDVAMKRASRARVALGECLSRKGIIGTGDEMAEVGR